MPRGQVRLLIIFLIALSLCTALAAVGKVRDVALPRNQVTVTMSKAGEFGLGKKIYFFRSGRLTGNGEVTQAFHTKAIARILSGTPQIGDDVADSARAPKAPGTKQHRISFAAANVQAQEFLVAIQFAGEEKLERKLTLNAELAVLPANANSYVGISAALVKEFDLLWQNGMLQVVRVHLSDRSVFELAGIIASDLFARIRPSAQNRGATVAGKITVLKKMRDVPRLFDGIEVELHVVPESARLKPGASYKLKIYCNELFAAEFLLKSRGGVLSEELLIAPVDVSPGENSLEFRLVEIIEQGDLVLETDNNQLLAIFLLDERRIDRNARVRIKLDKGYETRVESVQR